MSKPKCKQLVSRLFFDNKLGKLFCCPCRNVEYRPTLTEIEFFMGASTAFPHRGKDTIPYSRFGIY